MGSHIKTSIFDERASKALKKWLNEAKKRHKKGSSHARSLTSSPSPGQSPMMSPTSRDLYRFKSMGYTGEGFRRSHSDNELSDIEIEMPVARSERNQRNSLHEVQLSIEDGRDEEDDFSFVKLGSRNQQRI